MIIEAAILFSGSFMIALSGALMPGPLFTVAVADSARRGFISGPLLILGHSILELALVIAVLKGLDHYLQMDSVTGAIAFAGGGILLWMGAGMLRSAGGMTLAVEASQNTPPGGNLVITGILASISNPYWTLWWATVGLGYLTSSLRFGAPGVVIFYLGHIAADFAWFSLITFSVSRGRTLFSDRTYQWIIRVCGILLLAFGAMFLGSSIVTISRLTGV